MSPAWSDLENHDSNLVKMLVRCILEDADKKGLPGAFSDRDNLIMFGILHCQGSPQDKATAWFNLLQKSDAQFISVSDKEFITVVNKMLTYVTSDAFTVFAEIGEYEKLYSEDEL